MCTTNPTAVIIDTFFPKLPYKTNKVSRQLHFLIDFYFLLVQARLRLMNFFDFFSKINHFEDQRLGAKPNFFLSHPVEW